MHTAYLVKMFCFALKHSVWRTDSSSALYYLVENVCPTAISYNSYCIFLIV